MFSATALFSVDNYRMDDSVGYLLSRSRAMLAKALDAALVDSDITHTQAGVVMMLSSGNYVTATDLVRELYIDAASMTRMLDRLQKRSLVERVPHAEDRRQTQLRLTADGKALAARLPPIFIAVLNAQFTGFSAEEVGFLKSLLRKFMQAGSGTDTDRPA